MWAYAVLHKLSPQLLQVRKAFKLIHVSEKDKEKRRRTKDARISSASGASVTSSPPRSPPSLQPTARQLSGGSDRAASTEPFARSSLPSPPTRSPARTAEGSRRPTADSSGAAGLPGPGEQQQLLQSFG